jgi:uncharacterized protein YbaP (TraB family)
MLLWLGTSGALAADRGALFRLTLDGHVMHLFGTLHVGTPDFYPLEEHITDAVQAASTLALEIDPEQSRTGMQQALRTHGLLAPDAPTTYATLPPAQQERLARLLRQGGFDPTAMLTLKPVLLATMLTMSEYTRLGYRADLSSETWLAQTARAHGVRVTSLESLDEQLAALDRLPEPDRWRFLDEMMDTIATGAQRTEAQEIVRAWRTADRAALDSIAARCEADPSVSGRFVSRVLIQERNVTLATRLLQLLRSEARTVGAIGTLHLIGTGSVPALLEQGGVRVERIY